MAFYQTEQDTYIFKKFTTEVGLAEPPQIRETLRHYFGNVFYEHDFLWRTRCVKRN